MSQSLPLVIYGAGGLGRELLFLLKRTGRSVQGFLDDGVEPGTVIAGYPVLGGQEWLNQQAAEVLLAFGDSILRKKVFEKISSMKGVHLPDSIIDPKAVILDTAGVTLGQGSILTAGVVLTTGIHLGKSVLVNLNTTIGHDTVIGDFTSIMPGCNLAGNVRIGAEVFIGAGVNILGGVRVGDGALIGAGSVVNKDVPPGKKVVGVPAREMTR